MRIYISTAWVLSAALFSSAAAQGPDFVFDGASFASPADFNGGASIFRFDDIQGGKNFTLNRSNQGGVRLNVTRLDLMLTGEDDGSSTLASWCPDDEGCTSTAGFSRSSSTHIFH